MRQHTTSRHVGRVLRALRLVQRCSQLDLADRLSVHREAVSLMERGHQAVSVPLFVAWSRALATDPLDTLLAVLDPAFCREHLSILPLDDA